MDINLIHIPTHVKQLEQEASNIDWDGNVKEANCKRNIISYYQDYMEKHKTEYVPKF